MVSHQDEFLDKYYSLRGWTKEGRPTPEKLKELGLDFVLKDMAVK
jgi:aldehyde:ferredoxin oxidoreductase